jgi:hypothetical protein
MKIMKIMTQKLIKKCRKSSKIGVDRKGEKKVTFLLIRIMANLRPLCSQTLGKSPEAKNRRFLGSISYYIYSGIGQLGVTEYLPFLGPGKVA